MTPIRPVLHNAMVAAGVPVLDALGLLRAHADTLLLAQMREMGGLAWTRKEAPTKRILIASLKGTWKPHLAWEYSLAAGLTVRGAECSFLLCDKFFPKCDVKTHYNPTRSRCWACHAISRAFAKRLSADVHWLGSFVSSDEREHLRQTAMDTPYESLEGVRLDDIEIDATIRPSLLRFFRRGSLEETESARRVHREFIFAGLLAAKALPRVLDEAKPDVVIAVNGKFFAENILYQLCLRRGTTIYTYERGKIKNTINLARNAISVDWKTDDAWRPFKDRKLTNEEREQIQSYIAIREAGGETVLQYHPNPDRNREAIAGWFKGPVEGKRFVLLTNIIWDSAVHGKDVGFESMFDWIRSTIEFFGRKPEASLVIRIHPAEVKIESDVTQERALDFIRGAFGKLPSNVTVIPPESDIDSYRLIEAADSVLVYTSTVGLEAALKEKPTVVCGETHFAGKGFTLDVESEDGYYETLERVLTGQALELDWESAWKYAYVFFMRCMAPMPTTSEEKLGRVEGVTFSSLEELAPGRIKEIDRVCDAILNERDV